MREFKRRYRDLSPDTKKKISDALKGRRKPVEVRQRISLGLKKYWSSVAWEGEA